MDTYIYDALTLELNRGGIQRTLHARQGDAGIRRLRITLTNRNRIFDADGYTVTPFAVLETGEQVEMSADGLQIATDEILWIPPEGLFATAGMKTIELRISEGTRTLYSPQFAWMVEATVGAAAPGGTLNDPTHYQPVIPELDAAANPLTDTDELAIATDGSGGTRKAVRATLATVKTYLQSWIAAAIDTAIELIHIPDKLSELSNDTGYITAAALPTVDTALDETSGNPIANSAVAGAGFLTSADLPTVPTKASQLAHDSGMSVYFGIAYAGEVSGSTISAHLYAEDDAFSGANEQHLLILNLKGFGAGTTLSGKALRVCSKQTGGTDLIGTSAIMVDAFIGIAETPRSNTTVLLKYQPASAGGYWDLVGYMTPPANELPIYGAGTVNKVLRVQAGGSLAWDAETQELPAASAADAGKVLRVQTDGSAAWDAETQELPAASATDKGKVLRVQTDGSAAWDAETQELPAASATDKGKVLEVNSTGEAEWTQPAPKIYAGTIAYDATHSSTTQTKCAVTISGIGQNPRTELEEGALLLLIAQGNDIVATPQLQIYFSTGVGDQSGNTWYVYGRNIGSSSFDTWLQWDVGSIVVLAAHHTAIGQYNDRLEFTQLMAHSTIDEALRKQTALQATAGQVLTMGSNGRPQWQEPQGGESYVLPAATTDTLGGVKVAQTNPVVTDSNGRLSVNPYNMDWRGMTTCLTAALFNYRENTEFLIDNGVYTLEDLQQRFEDKNMMVIDGNSDAFIFVSARQCTLTVLDENYNESERSFGSGVLYVMKMPDGVMTIDSYSGNQLRQLIINGI